MSKFVTYNRQLAGACSTSYPKRRRFLDLIRQERFAKCVIIRASPCWNASRTTKLSADVKLTGKKKFETHLLASRHFKYFNPKCCCYLTGNNQSCSKNLNVFLSENIHREHGGCRSLAEKYVKVSGRGVTWKYSLCNNNFIWIVCNFLMNMFEIKLLPTDTKKTMYFIVPEQMYPIHSITGCSPV